MRSSDKNMLDQIDHIVVVMLENRSFDHMLGFLYTDQNNQSPLGHPYEGLTGEEANPDGKGNTVKVFKIPSDQHPYYWPGVNPGEGYYSTNSQLFGDYKTPQAGTEATNQGFITDFAFTLQWKRKDNEKKANRWPIVEGTEPSDIMGMYSPELLPVLSGLARSYAVCDHWYSSVPTQTLPNRAFVHMATSLGRLNNHDKKYNATTIFNLLEDAQLQWSLYGYQDDPILTRESLQALPANPEYGSFGNFDAFKQAAGNGSLASYTFLTPEWGFSGNSQHPNYDVAKGEQYLYNIYQTLRNSPVWNKTLLIITYDEHGGTYDHVAPPENAAQPADCPDNEGFNFQRFGVRVPTVLVSPLIEAGTVFRVSEPDQGLNGNTPSTTPFDHTSILATLEKRFGLSSLTARDAAAPDIGSVLTRTTARDDYPLRGVTPPKTEVAPVLENNGSWGQASELQKAEVELTSQLSKEGNYHSRSEYDINSEDGAKRYSRYRYHRHHG
ncbi:phosphoesterase [Microbulbifer sp. A4B17]|uniref:alkaline phosphatase family protein n=1 Tax=Microbulbifer sp. A4B17 TaxID=359370 RepID=UPI000D52D6DE|nr:alkaline phosphatase family protein [Microbulbifer sp. A4B17]AWF80548.1 phosphoesterase [Microbulbifer sp. A4B17]